MAINKNELIQAAAKTRELAVTPCSRLKVGAALLTEGKTDFAAVAAVVRWAGGPVPSTHGGHC